MQNAKAMADSLVAGDCNLAHATVFVNAVTDASWTKIEGCAQGDSGTGNGSGSTKGSTGEAVRYRSHVGLLSEARKM
jgi:hypothetical protein